MLSYTTAKNTRSYKMGDAYSAPSFRYSDFLRAISRKANSIPNFNLCDADRVLYLEKTLSAAAETVAKFQEHYELGSDNDAITVFSKNNDSAWATKEDELVDSWTVSSFSPQTFMLKIRCQAEEIYLSDDSDEIKLQKLKNLFRVAASVLYDII